MDTILTKGIIYEDFVNYKSPSMYIALPYCDLKCDKEYGSGICQNSELLKQMTYKISVEEICNNYINNSITKAIVLGGLEPFITFKSIVSIADTFRHKLNCNDPIIIYTGYTEDEIVEEVNYLKHHFNNIIIKFGRFIPNQPSHYEELLGVNLASPNQYARQVC